jgi:hypothetical protein
VQRRLQRVWWQFALVELRLRRVGRQSPPVSWQSQRVQRRPQPVWWQFALVELRLRRVGRQSPPVS